MPAFLAALPLLLASGAVAADLSPAEEAALCRQLVVGMAGATSGQSKTFRMRIAGHVLLVKATLAEDGTLGLEPGEGSSIDLRAIRPMVDVKGRLAGIALDANGDGAPDRGVAIQAGVPQAVDVDRIPGQPVTSAREFGLIAVK